MNKFSSKISFGLFLAYIFSCSCDDLVPMLTDGEFTQAVETIESKIGELHSEKGKATLVKQVEADGTTFYYTEEDMENPVFISEGVEDVGKSTIILSRGEDHLSHEDRNVFVVLQQKQDHDYTVHSAYVDRLEADTVIWSDATVKMMDGAEVILELYGGTFYNMERPHCAWFGMTVMLCCIKTLEEKTELAVQKLKSSGPNRPAGSSGMGSTGNIGPSYNVKTKPKTNEIRDDKFTGSGNNKPFQNDNFTGSGNNKPFQNDKFTGSINNKPFQNDKFTGSINNKQFQNDKFTGSTNNKPFQTHKGGSDSAEIYLTLKEGPNSKAKGRKLGTTLSRKIPKQGSKPQNKVSKRQTVVDFRPRYTAW